MLIRAFIFGCDKVIKNNKIKFNVDVRVDNEDFENNSNKKVLVICEPNAIRSPTYDYEKYDLILTYDDVLLKRNKSKLLLHGTKKVDLYNNTYNKKNKISFIVGRKCVTVGHKLRHEIYYNQQKINNFVVYVSENWNTVRKNNKFNNPILREIKNDALDLYKFHLTIENSRQTNYFTEKIIDCFYTHTVPIYWGCPNIEQYFNIKGIIILDTNDISEIINKINSIDLEEFYNNNIDAIKDNFEKCREYFDYTGRMMNIIENNFS